MRCSFFDYLFDPDLARFRFALAISASLLRPISIDRSALNDSALTVPPPRWIADGAELSRKFGTMIVSRTGGWDTRLPRGRTEL